MHVSYLLHTGEDRSSQTSTKGPHSPQSRLKVLPALAPPPSRYHQDWEELEFLVRTCS